MSNWPRTLSRVRGLALLRAVLKRPYLRSKPFFIVHPYLGLGGFLWHDYCAKEGGFLEILGLGRWPAFTPMVPQPISKSENLGSCIPPPLP